MAMETTRRPYGETSSPRPPAQRNRALFDRVLPPASRSDFQDPRSYRPPRHMNTVGTNPVSTSSPPRTSSITHNAMQSVEQLDDLSSQKIPQPWKQHDVSRSSSPVSGLSSNGTSGTEPTSAELPPLQNKSALEHGDLMEPLSGDLQGSFDLVSPPEGGHHGFSLEDRSELLFSREHLTTIFSNPSSLLRFTAFLSTHRPASVPMLIYYLDALKAIKAVRYANAIVEALNPVAEHPFTNTQCKATENLELERKACDAFKVLVDHDLPAYITQSYIRIVSLSISRRITGALAPHLREASEGLAEVFCLTDPARPDNPIVFASEEFNRTTQYGLNYVLGRNCRFLQGPKTNPLSVRRLGDAVRSGKDHCEVFLNYRRDGSPFMNMLMTAPLRDSRGKIRYFIGAQVDVSGLVKDCTDLESLQQLVQPGQTSSRANGEGSDKDDFRELSEMLNMSELETVRKHGGRMHREYQEDDSVNTHSKAPHMARLLLHEPNADVGIISPGQGQSGKLSGIYQNYLLIRPFPSFRILFASPTLRVPGILQSPFMEKIGGSSRVREELSSALGEGRGVTAKIRWLSRFDEEGRNRWIHCTPLIGSNGQIGVWMVVLIDEEEEISRRWKQAPPVAAGPHRGKVYGAPLREGMGSKDSVEAKRDTSEAGRPGLSQYSTRQGAGESRTRSASPNSVRI